MPGQDVARQWFVPGEGIDRTVISADIQRYLGNDATVRPGVGTGEYQGQPGFWIKAYRNLTSAMISDLRADSSRWRQEQRQTGVGPTSYVGSRTYDESNAAGSQRQDRNSPSLDAYGNPVSSRHMDRPVDPRRQAVDPMQIDTPPGRAPQVQPYGQPEYYPQDQRGQYQDPSRYPPPARGNGYDQPMEGYGPPDAYGRYPVNQPYPQQGRNAPGYAPPPQGPPPGHVRQGEYYVPITSGYGQPGMPATVGPDGYFAGGQQPPQGRGAVPPNQRDPRAPQRDSGYGQQEYNPYPSPAQTVANPQERETFVNPTQQGYAPQQPQTPYDQYGRPVQPYSPDAGYAPPSRGSNTGRQEVPAQTTERRREGHGGRRNR